MRRAISKMGLVYDDNKPLQPQLDILKKIIFELAEKTRYYENIEFISSFCNVNDFQKSKEIVDDFYNTNQLNYNLKPNINKISRFQVDPNNNYAKDYGTIHFDMFSVQVINYVSLLTVQELLESGKDYHYIVDNKKEITDLSNEKVNNIVPFKIKQWRNKVGAHSAGTYPLKSDNVATIIESLNTYPEYNSPYFIVSLKNVSMVDEESQLLLWSITNSYRNLNYLWPEYNLSPLLFEVYFDDYFKENI